MSGSVDIVRRYLVAVERFDVAAVDELLDPQMKFQELPNLIRPDGGTDDKAAMLAALRRSAERKVLKAQRYRIDHVLAEGEQVMVEPRWEGDLAVPLGRLQPGETMVAHICMVFRLSNGRIVQQRNYDCYEDFRPK